MTGQIRSRKGNNRKSIAPAGRGRRIASASGEILTARPRLIPISKPRIGSKTQSSRPSRAVSMRAGAA